MEYKIVRHPRRKRLLLTVSVTGAVTVKASPFVTEQYIEKFVDSHKEWIEERKKYYSDVYHTRVTVAKEEREKIKKQFLPEMVKLTEKYAAVMGVAPKSIKITSAERRWGSCSSDNSVCYSYRCAFLSQRCKEYIVVHELSHIKEHNHSKKFYGVVKTYMPDYKQREKELNGHYIQMG